MAAFTISQETTSPVAPARLFKALALERHVLITKVMPQAFKSVEVVQGDGGVGTVIKFTFPEGAPFKYMLQRVDEIDAANLYAKYTVFEGDVLRERVSITHEAKFAPAGEGTLGKFTSHHYPKPGATVDEQEIKKGEEKAHAFFKKVEEYLLANPDVYA